jgi:hypothetical protein
MKKFKINFFILLTAIVLSGCKDNTVDTVNETLIYQLDGLIENIGGDCSAVQVRTRSLGTLDLTVADKIKFNFNGMSDADMSSLSIYYVNDNDEQVNLVNLTDRDQINNTINVTVDSPLLNTELYSRVTLRSSVCTGQIFYLTFRDLKIYSITQ